MHKCNYIQVNARGKNEDKILEWTIKDSIQEMILSTQLRADKKWKKKGRIKDISQTF